MDASERRTTLGLMVDWLELAQKAPPRHPAIQALADWLVKNNRRLKQHRDFARLRLRLVEGRNRAVHEQVSEQDALDLCRDLNSS